MITIICIPRTFWGILETFKALRRNAYAFPPNSKGPRSRVPDPCWKINHLPKKVAVASRSHLMLLATPYVSLGLERSGPPEAANCFPQRSHTHGNGFRETASQKMTEIGMGILEKIRNLVDLKGFEPLTSSMPWKRAPNCATGPSFFFYVMRIPHRSYQDAKLLIAEKDAPNWHSYY
jgi:hypothetical protein